MKITIHMKRFKRFLLLLLLAFAGWVLMLGVLYLVYLAVDAL